MTNSAANIIVNIKCNIKIEFNIDDYIQKCLKAASLLTGTFEFTFINDDTMIELNMSYFNKNYSTDVITFNLNTNDDPLADIYICVDEASRNALEYNKDLTTELKLLIIHGLLHVKGYEDYTDEQRKIMFKEQDRLLEIIGEIK